MHILSFALALFFSSANALPASNIQPLLPSNVALFRPYTHYASAGYCNPSSIISWSCGLDCNSNPSFHPVASGGDGALVQYWFVGYDSALDTVVVVNQGTDPFRMYVVSTELPTLVSLAIQCSPGHRSRSRPYRSRYRSLS